MEVKSGKLYQTLGSYLNCRIEFNHIKRSITSLSNDYWFAKYLVWKA